MCRHGGWLGLCPSLLSLSPLRQGFIALPAVLCTFHLQRDTRPCVYDLLTFRRKCTPTDTQEQIARWEREAKKSGNDAALKQACFFLVLAQRRSIISSSLRPRCMCMARSTARVHCLHAKSFGS